MTKDEIDKICRESGSAHTSNDNASYLSVDTDVLCPSIAQRKLLGKVGDHIVHVGWINIFHNYFLISFFRVCISFISWVRSPLRGVSRIKVLSLSFGWFISAEKPSRDISPVPMLA